MADEAFALSPITARSASPTDADYDAIQEAFLETARGRWFLGEYAKRNRNADTAMVLEAVARLEQNLAASRMEAKAAEPSPSSGVTPVSAEAASSASHEIFTPVKALLERTRADIAAAFESTDLAATLEPLHNSARIIREIAWGLRESGADGRICNILDTQVRAIAGVCEALAETGHPGSVLHIFDASLEEIERLAGGQMASSTEGIVETIVSDVALPDTNASEIDAPVIDEPAPVPATMVATAETDQDKISQDPATKLPAVAIAEDLIMETRAAPSLGDSLIARGIVAPSSPAPHDPLAPIRRMSQAEKIAFFS